MFMSKVAVVGAGAVGTYYGARLAEQGHDVAFVLRSDYSAVAERGITVNSKDGDIRLHSPRITKDPAELAQTFQPDWILCALKATARPDAERLISPLIEADTRLLAIINGLGIEEEFAKWMDPKRVFGGLAFTCINRSEPSVIDHLDYGPLTITHLGDDPSELAIAISLWEKVKVVTSVADSRLAARYLKLCWNIPFNGLCVLAGGVTTEVIMLDPSLRSLAEKIMREVIEIGNADLINSTGELAPQLDNRVIDEMMTMTDTMIDYKPSTMIDFVEGREMEIDAIFQVALARGLALGVECVELQKMTKALHSISNQDK
ncbi:MAG TPA: 2-dehydropantoate 2-reductase [Dehalococcoidia bacterium]|nr:2-dehydropantoate 2-reductase [Dehalococcoidia bacterium]